MKKTILITGLIFCSISIHSYAQSVNDAHKSLETIRSVGTPNDFPELINANIPGAPKLGKPQLIMGASIPVMGEGYGWAAPAVYDLDDDGKKDLLIGEFGSGMEDKGMVIGNFVRFYQNTGTDAAPEFNDELSSYVHGMKNLSTGSPLSIYTWCCIPFTPRFKDLNNDGFMDLLTGQYNPGYINWFRGSEQGFLPGKKLEESYDALTAYEERLNHYSLPITDPKSPDYWIYSAADFGDFDNDGDQDMIVGGHALRFCENIGTKSLPKFGKRELLLDEQGQPLDLNGKLVPYVIDWDGDGMLDILLTDSFYDRKNVAIRYIRGVKTKEGLRFKRAIPLFTAKNGEKEFPGAWLNLCVTDWNNDGINDLLIGTSVATLNGTFNQELSWQWEHDTGISKLSPAYYSTNMKKMVTENIKKAAAFEEKMKFTDAEIENRNPRTTSRGLIKHFYGKDGYKNKTLAHQGYVYLMLGEKIYE